MVLSLFIILLTLSQAHASYKFLDQSGQNQLREHSLLFHISFLVTATFSTEQAVYEVGKGVSVVFEVALGGECQQTSAPHYLGCKSSYNSGRNLQDLVQWLEVLAQLERKWMEAAGEAHLQ